MSGDRGTNPKPDDNAVIMKRFVLPLFHAIS